MKKSKLTGKSRAAKMYPLGGAVEDPIPTKGVRRIDLGGSASVGNGTGTGWRNPQAPYSWPYEGKEQPTWESQEGRNKYAKMFNTMLGYFINNNPESNIYRTENQHYSIDPVKDELSDKPMFAAAGGVAGASPWGGLISQVPAIADGIINLLENNPNAYSRQPIMNASTIRGMATPYDSFALGGEADAEDQLSQLQSLADEQGISIEELLSMLQDQQNPDSMDDGIEDIPFEDIPDEEEVESDDNEEEELGETFAYGGRSGRKVPVEVEGKEVLETPNGMLHRAVGPSHANGGVKLNVPPGTKIYSDRVKVDGKTMQERKVKREKAEKRIEKLKLKNPHDKLLQSSLQRTIEVNQAEEAEDMQLQEALNSMQGNKYPYGGGPGRPWRGAPYPYPEGDIDFDPLAGTLLSDSNLDPIPMARPSLITSGSLRSSTTLPPLTGTNRPDVGLPAAGSAPSVEVPSQDGFTTGDYLGMAGNLFNAIAPIINTRNAAAATHPTINRYTGFGHEAIQDNDASQSMAGTMQANALSDIDISSNSAKSRNRNSAQSVNTLRALDAITDMGVNKAKVGARDAFTRQMIGLRGQRGQFTNLRDRMVMSGQERADIENQAKTDNYFSNNAANLVNAGNQIQGLASNLNTSHQNQVDSNLIASMTKNPIKVDRNGKIVNRNMTPEQVQVMLDFGYTIEDGKLIAPRKRG